MGWVLDHSDAELASRLVLLAIANHADAHGRNAWPSQATIAAEAHVSERTVRRCIDALVDLGELEVKQYAGGTNGRGRTNYYELPLFWATLPADKLSGVETGQTRTSAPQTRTSAPQTRTPVADEPSLEPSEEPSTTSSSADAADEERPEVRSLCDHLADRIEANGSKRPAVTARWLDACRLMIDRDGRTPDQIRRAIDWCQSDEFWRANVMSMPKLRQQFDTLRLRAKAQGAPSRRRPSKGEVALARLAELEGHQGDPLELLAR